MDNVLAWKLGKVAKEAGNPDRKGVGDTIDRGLILRRLLEEEGFGLIELPHHDPKEEEIRQRLKAR